MSRDIDEPPELPSEEIRTARPPVDQLRMAAVRARAEAAMFGTAEPAQLGRYVLLGPRVDGGMGVVYSAYDPELDRKVALKVLHPRQRLNVRARERLIVEARALAKLDHPNVVKIHDVVAIDEQIVIVMEWVAGRTLIAWERERARSADEIFVVYVQAGRGLAAAHGVGVVHRDFKPSNAVLGDDGRVRVLDFGLARQIGDAIEPAGAGGAEVPAELTATGDVVGTLAFSAPEQLAGEPATPESDQFSFAVSLHRALEGVAPFGGEDVAGLLREIRAGAIALASDGRTVLAWQRALLARALAADPAKRFPSIGALIAELERPRGWRRWRGAIAVGAIVGALTVALVVRSSGAPMTDCDRGRAEGDAVWGGAQRDRVERAFDRIATSYARGSRSRVLRGLDDFRDRWAAMHREACVAHRDGEQSAALLDRRMSCMQKRLSDLRAAVAALEQIDGASAANAVDVVAKMPALTECADAERLQAEVPLPSNPAQRRVVEAIQARLSESAALDRAGRSTEALAAADRALADAERGSYAPSVAEAALQRGRVLVTRHELRPAVASLLRARTIALEQRMFPVAVEAAARQLFSEGTVDARIALLERDAAMFLPLSAGLVGDHFARPLLLNNIGTLYMAAGDRDAATRYFQDAARALAGVAEPDLELTCIDKNLAMVTRDYKAREELARGVWQRLRAQLGDAHLSTIDAADSYARFVTEPARALVLLGPVCDSYDTFHPSLIELRVYCRSYRAFLAGEAGQREQQLASYDGIVELARGSTDEDVVARSALAVGSAKLLRGDPRGAIAAWQPVATEDARDRNWWIRLRAAHAEVGLGQAEHALGHNAAAMPHFATAMATYREASASNEETEHRFRLAMAERLMREVGGAPKIGNKSGAGVTKLP